MKRFWKVAEPVESNDGWTIELDGRPVHTPARALLQLPTKALADAIAAEWSGAADTIDPRAMPLTGLANAAVDRIQPDPESFARDLGRYAQGDLACYRAEGPRELVSLQAESWDALLAWGRRRFDVDFQTTSGVMHVDQPIATVERLSHAVASVAPFQLAGLSPLVTIGGSLLAALAVLEKAMTPEAAWGCVTVDGRWQLSQWGADSEARQRLDNNRRDFLAAARFLELLDA
ncbi:ATPase [Sphingomonas sinipercae]|uniref:ATPase n=1 Tax=Sphingomonas sinipercae TaxID=2714944 RepID=A0A6G7ZLV9_9SPHN|nr:ATP12 family protein [Sphingomonas sinipercae]QIL01923.1 ATPase [Sphingomonas sinipercae]